MNITQSLSSLSSWSSGSISQSPNSFVNSLLSSNSLVSDGSLQFYQESLENQRQIESNQHLFGSIQNYSTQMYLNQQLVEQSKLNYNLVNQQFVNQQQQQPCQQPLLQFQFRRPITGLHNLNHVKNKNQQSQQYSPFILNPNGTPLKYSRKVFVGGLPPDIDENEIVQHFRCYGQLIVDWPHKSESKSQFPPKGYAFLIFERELSVQDLIKNCSVSKEKYYICISSPSIKDKPVQIRPWCLSDSEFFMDASLSVDSRRTIFVGGVPRPLKAYELANIMNRLYGGVCYAGIDIDPELKYPKGAGRVSFSNHSSYVSAISARFVQLQHCEIDKRAEVKPYVLDDQICDICKGSKCNNRNAPFFCANISCLQYYCEACWSNYHSKPGRDFHKPLVKEGADRPRTIPFKWC